jgi:ATP-dependent RNA helicase RhlE
VHRIGRTARAGREGRAIALCAPDERAFLKDIERTIRMQLDQQALPANFRDLVGLTAKLIKSSPSAADPPREERDFNRSPGGRGRDPRAVVHADGRGPRREGGRDAARDGARREGGPGRPANAARPQGRTGGGFGGQRNSGQRRSPAGR